MVGDELFGMPSLGMMSAKAGWFPCRFESIFWSLQSYTWDDYLQLPECREEIRVTAAWLAGQLSGAARRVLDVGCGTGNYALALAELGCEVVGIDYAAGMLRRARAKAAQLASSRVTFEAVDFDQGLPFAAGSFDGAIGVAVLQCAADPRRFLGEVRRVLKPGGLFLLVALDPAQKSAAKRKLKTTLPRLLLRGIKALASRSRSVRRYSREEVRAYLAGAGFEVMEERASLGTVALLCQA